MFMNKVTFKLNVSSLFENCNIIGGGGGLVVAI